MIKVMKRLVLECSCHQAQHLAVVCYDIDDQGHEELYFEFQLSPGLPFWERLKSAAKYIVWPYHTVVWDDVVMGDDTVKKLRSFLTKESS